MNKHLVTALNELAKSQKLEIGRSSHFEGDKYIIAKPYTINLKYADARCGKRVALILQLPDGRIAPLTDYLTFPKIERLLLNPIENYNIEIETYRRIYK